MKISPGQIYDYLDERIVGQDEAKKSVSTAMFLHVLRLLEQEKENTPIKKHNLLLMGPTGCGKTYLTHLACEAVQQILGYDICPMLELDCTELTSAGWAGQDFSKCIEDHYKEMGDTLKFRSTVVFLDEFDKLASPAIGREGTDHNRNTQYNLLKGIEGAFFAPGQRAPTHDMLFILAGNFAEVRADRVARVKPSMGFRDPETKGGVPEEQISFIQELDKAGVATQIVGRLSDVAELTSLNKAELTDVFHRFVLPDYHEMFTASGKYLQLTSDDESTIIETCINNKTGARGLQAALSTTIKDQLFELSINV